MITHCTVLAGRGESPAAFAERRIPADGVTPRSDTGGILTRRALFARCRTRLCATRDSRHGLLAALREGCGRS